MKDGLEGYWCILLVVIRYGGHIDISRIRMTPQHFAAWIRKAKLAPYDVVLSRHRFAVRFPHPPCRGAGVVATLAPVDRLLNVW